jgi:hypothetical protein
MKVIILQHFPAHYNRKYPIIPIFHPTPTDALEIVILSGREDRMRPIY